MSSGLIKCPKCEKVFSIMPIINNKMVILEQPWTCPHCKEKILSKDLR